MFSKEGFNTYAANTSKYKDLGELIEEEPRILSKVIDRKTDSFTYLLTRKLKSLDITNYEDHQKVLNYIGVLLQNSNDPAVLEFYLEKIEKLTGIKPEIIRERVAEIRKSGRIRSQPSQQ